MLQLRILWFLFHNAGHCPCPGLAWPSLSQQCFFAFFFSLVCNAVFSPQGPVWCVVCGVWCVVCAVVNFPCTHRPTQPNPAITKGDFFLRIDRFRMCRIIPCPKRKKRRRKRKKHVTSIITPSVVPDPHWFVYHRWKKKEKKKEEDKDGDAKHGHGRAVQYKYTHYELTLPLPLPPLWDRKCVR